jgi:hypothetical protein
MVGTPSKFPKFFWSGFVETHFPSIFAVPFEGKAQNQRILEGFEGFVLKWFITTGAPGDIGGATFIE